MNTKTMNTRTTVDGYTFDYNTENKMYECRGDVCYDDEHDEVPESGLWDAAMKLEKRLRGQGFNTEAGHSEKGWVEVVILD